MIPKICHLIWTSGSPMSLLQTFTIKTFHGLNPDWDIVVHLYKQKPQELGINNYVPDYTGKDYFDQILYDTQIWQLDLKKEGIVLDKPYMMISDIIRMRMLYRYGGVYSDFDTLWLKSMSEFKNIDCFGDPEDFDTTDCFYKLICGHHNNSNIISKPKTGYLKFMINEQNKVRSPYTHQAFNTDLSNRLFPEAGILLKRFPKMLLMDYKTFYPYSIMNLAELYLQDNLSVLTDKVMAVHWFNGHHLSQTYLKEFGRPCSMTTILKQKGLI